MQHCKFQLFPDKAEIVNFRGETERKYPRSLNFLGFTIKLHLVKTMVGLKFKTTSVKSRKSKSAILEKFRTMKLHKNRTPFEGFQSKRLSPAVVRGLINYY
jgi:hypothetical protein